MGTKNLLDQQNQILMEQIDDTKQQIDLYAQQIETYQEMEEEQYSLFVSRYAARRSGAACPTGRCCSRLPALLTC